MKDYPMGILQLLNTIVVVYKTNYNRRNIKFVKNELESNPWQDFECNLCFRK